MPSDENSTPNFIKWIAVLPCAILVSLVILYIGNAIFSTIVQTPLQPDGLGYAILYGVNFIINFVGGFCFVGAGAWCAPSRHKQVAFVLMLLTGIGTITVFLFDITTLGFIITLGRTSGAFLNFLRIKKEIIEIAKT